MKGVALKLGCIETVQFLNSDHRSMLMRLGSLDGNCPLLQKTIKNRQKVSTALEEIDTLILKSIPNDIVFTDDIDNAIGALTEHIRTVVDDSSRVVPANSDRKELPRDVNELIRAKNAALYRVSKYSTCEIRYHAHALQRKARARMQEARNDNWSDLLIEISSSHKASWISQSSQNGRVSLHSRFKKPDNSIAFDDREKAVFS
ncbi:hypothetical protein EVAR_16504_1 [Eumeta japonica]|uniref:Uncharacterized protein n=1 Tax=Eumeta variegata TaxID=151549 RepID=A0A4C1ULS1_EUMVA|nr:hypothetical protein EVAR_16504_1 [Eumeta japonica]